MSPMDIIGACAVALVVLAYACGLTGFIVDGRAKAREAAIEASHVAAIAGISEQLANLRAVVNANAGKDEELEAFVRMLADERIRKADVDEDEPVDEQPSTPEIWDRFATPLVLPESPDVRTQLTPPPDWTRATATFDRISARHPGLLEATPSWELSAFTRADAEQVRELAEANA